MKKIISMFLVSVAAISLLVGCGSSGNNGEEESTQQTVQEKETNNTTQDQRNTEAVSDTGSENGKTLIVYYSATGNTKAVANTIAETTGGDLLELEPVEPYSNEDLDWTDESSRVSREYENEDERDVELVSTEVDDWESYDTVFIGYPIWWAIAAWPVNDFVEANDFTGKTVIPFCTSATSGIGESGELLADLAGTGDWQEGQRFRSGADDKEIQEWVESLGL